MKTILTSVSLFLLLSACSSSSEGLVTEDTVYKNETYGFQLTFPETWLPINEEVENGADGAVAQISLIGGDQVIQIGSGGLYLRSIYIGVYPIAEKEAQMENKFGVYNKYLGENENYSFFYDAKLLYMYPYACDHIDSDKEEELCEEYKPAYEDTQALVTSFVEY